TLLTLLPVGKSVLLRLDFAHGFEIPAPRTCDPARHGFGDAFAGAGQSACRAPQEAAGRASRAASAVAPSPTRNEPPCGRSQAPACGKGPCVGFPVRRAEGRAR